MNTEEFNKYWTIVMPIYEVYEVYGTKEYDFNNNWTGKYLIYKKELDNYNYLCTQDPSYLFETEKEAVDRLEVILKQEIRNIKNKISDLKQQKEELTEKLFTIYSTNEY